MSARDVGLEAADWLLRMNDTDSEPEVARNEAFLDWIESSPEHLRLFLETMETHQRLMGMEQEDLRKIRDLLASRPAEVIPLYGESPITPPAHRRRRGPYLAAAVVATVTIAATLAYWLAFEPTVYRTAVGEQRTAKLADGSFIYLNTDTRVQVSFSETTRNVRLLQGEALFVVEHDSSRAFIVDAGGTSIRAIGTQFNVRRLQERTEVSVVEGVVQVAGSAADATADTSLRLKAGDRASVSRDRVVAKPNASVTDALAWRQRRLVFHDATLAEVAVEFNRYNRTKIRIDDRAADFKLTGIFDADRPQALMLYAAGSDALVVEPSGDDWVIRRR